MRGNGSQLKNPDDWAIDTGPRMPLPNADFEMSAERQIPKGRNVLTQEEIAALLRPNLPDDIGLPIEPKRIEPKRPVQFTENRDSLVTTEMRTEAGAMAARLSLALGRATGVKAAVCLSDVAPVQTQALAGLMNGKAGAVACFGVKETEANVLICLPGPFADALIAQACGSRGSTGRIGDGWTLSAIDCALLEQLLGPLAGALGDGLRLQAIETDVPYVTSLLPAGEVIVAEYSVEAPGLRSEMAVISTRNAAQTTPKQVQLRGKTPMTAVMTARIASLSVPMSHLTSLKAGSTLLLGLPADQPVELLSGGRDGPVAFEGQVGRKGNKVAIKITRKLRGLLD